MLFSKFSAELDCEHVVKITTTKVAVRFVTDNARFLAFEASNGYCGLGMAEVDEGDDSLCLLGEVILAEETIVVNNRSAFVDDSEALEASDVAGIHECLTFGVGGVRWNRDHNVFSCDIILNVELMQFPEVKGQNLLRSENVNVASLSDLEGDFVVGQSDTLVRDEPFLELDLGCTLAVESEETGWEED